MTMGTAFYSWKEAEGGNVGPLILGGAIGGLVIAIVLIFKRNGALLPGTLVCPG